MNTADGVMQRMPAQSDGHAGMARVLLRMRVADQRKAGAEVEVEVEVEEARLREEATKTRVEVSARMAVEPMGMTLAQEEAVSFLRAVFATSSMR